ncbi:MAG: hypothetical protein K2X43_19520 [Hyphomonadaceae bacterium]|jgi:hypothetical protein|nr:hypothetical protein [Hyphomonadaceae bacterium]
MTESGGISRIEAEAAALKAAADLYHAYLTGLILTLVTRRSADDAAEWVFRVFRHQHHEKFLSSFDKLGLKGLPDAVACAAYHYLSNSIGGVSVEFMRESDRKAWVNFVPPRWIYPGASICGVPSQVSRAFLRGWYAQNGASLGNPRLGFVCTAQTTDGQHGLSGYFLEHDRDLEPQERLQFRPGELPPPFDPAAAPRLPAADWPPERLAKAARNYAMDYIRSGLPRLVEIFGPAEASHLGRVTGRLIGAQLYRQTAAQLGAAAGGAEAFGTYMMRLAAGEGDRAQTARQGDAVLVRRESWRLMQGLEPLSPAVFEAWGGLLEGALAVHDRFCVLEVLSRRDWGDDAFVWRIRPRAGQSA